MPRIRALMSMNMKHANWRKYKGSILLFSILLYFHVFLVACRWIFRIGHLQISCCNKGGDVTLSILGMHADSNSVKYLFGGSRNRTEIDHIPLLVRQ